ncbi:hypothetical protein K2173_008213 [Erythroxylum novogranatense]|uniref:Trehalose-6-phosphate synthase n=1 Tax=Erythroxylum novogranatense TaxID=1862640 RepID=A0AAV8S784_9ROSI|nr:hypothetical protein K2173_008213 [Erythroxylum novogranatense]
MVSRSSISLLDLVSGDMMNFCQTPRSLPRVMTVPGIIHDIDGDGSNDGDSDAALSNCHGKKIIVANFLPLHAERDLQSGKWFFSFDEDSLLLQMKDGLSSDTEVVYVGSLKVDVDAGEQEEVSQKLLEEFDCIPTFLPPDLQKNFYHGFCKHYLWPLFHYMLPMSPDIGNRFDRLLWQAYVSANKIFADKVMEVINPEDDYVWVHDYHLMITNQTGSYWTRIFWSHYICQNFACGIHLGRLESALNHPSSSIKVKEIQEQFRDKLLIVGVDDMDIFKGISLKLLAMEQLLQQNPELTGKLVMVQIINPARSSGKDILEANRETYLITQRINDTFGFPGYEPVVLIDQPISVYEKTAYYALAECVIVNAVRDGMNLIPYKYIVCRQGTEKMNQTLGVSSDSPHTSTLVVSEFIGCSPSLSGAIRVNPWDVEAVADALNVAITMPDLEKRLRHEKHYRYVSSHDVAYWAHSFMQDLERACKDHYSKRCWRIGFGLSFRILALSPSFRKLSNDHIVSAYKKTHRRAIFLDYDGTVVPQTSIVKTPSHEVISVLNSLCSDPKNTVFIVSGRGRDSLSEWFLNAMILV